MAELRAVGQRGTAVQTHGQLDAHPRPLALDAAEETEVEFACRRAHQPGLDRDTRCAQLRHAVAVDLRKRIFGRHYHACHARGDQRVCAGRCAPPMRAGFQRHVGRRATRPFARFAQGEHFGMRLARALVPALPEHVFAAGDDAAHARIRLRGGEAALGQAKGLRHVHVVDAVEGVWTSIHKRSVCAIDCHLSPCAPQE
jgi:hypothetical protein